MVMQSNEYTEIIKETARIIALSNAKNKGKENLSRADREQIAELYGIYYNACAGAIRSGVMYSKEMDIDGYPKFVISIGNVMFPCRDIALRDILGEDFEKLTQYPYEDTSASYVKHYAPSIPVPDDYAEMQNANRRKEAKEKELARKEKEKQVNVEPEEIRELKKDKRGFRYDPEYDHYYSDRLPEIINELDSRKAVTIGRIAAIILSCTGIFLSLVFL